MLNALNFRLDAATIAFILEHGGAKVLITDREFSPVIEAALARCSRRGRWSIDIDDPLAEAGRACSARPTTRRFLAEGDPALRLDSARGRVAGDLRSTTPRGTTGNPKGVVYHHRGAYLNAIGNVDHLRA